MSAPADIAPSNRNFRAVWPSLFVLTLGLMAVIPMLPLWLEERYGLRDPEQLRWWAGAIYAAGPLAAAFTGPFWGALGDRVGRRAMVVRAAAAIGVCSAVIPLAPTPLAMLVVRLVQGVFAGYVAPALALVSADVPPQERGRTLGRLQVAMAAGLLLGPPFGAELSTWWSRAAVFEVTAVLSLLAAVVVAVFARETRPPPTARGGLLAELLLSPPRLVLRQPLLGVLLLLVFLMRFGQQMPEPFVALWVRELGALDLLRPAAPEAAAADVVAVDRTTALAFTVMAVAQIAFAPRWGRLADRFGPLRCLGAVGIGAGACLVAVSLLVRAVPEYLVLRALQAVFLAGSMTLAYAAVTRRVEPARQATGFALAQSFMQLGLGLGPMAGAGLASWSGSGLRGVFAAAGAALAVAGAAMLALRRVSPPRDDAGVPAPSRPGPAAGGV